jgi:dihydrofolate synthase/folylpolyglutamate synthase
MQIQNYQQALDYLYSFLDTEKIMPRRSVEYNLPRTFALFEATCNAHQHFPSIVVAGTKGKGSTSAFTESILRQSGKKVGFWSSPHLHSYRERIQIDRQPISQADLIRHVQAIKPLIDAFDVQTHGYPTVFELGFLIAMRYFAEQQVDIAIIEVGLGGRYDTANAVTPILSVVASISYDHMAILGDTLTKIASEKAGIFKPNIPAITCVQDPEAEAEIIRIAQETGTPLWISADAPPQQHDGITRFDPFVQHQGTHQLGLAGEFQIENARLATGIALLLRQQGWPISDQNISDGLAQTQWPGRMELVAGQPNIVLDGAHNGDSAHKLIASLRQSYPNSKIILVLGMSNDKDADRVLRELIPASHALVLTRSRHPRAWSNLDTLEAQVRRFSEPNTQIVQTPDVPEAIEQARALAGPNDVICVTGSLFVVAAGREVLGIAGEVD